MIDDKSNESRWKHCLFAQVDIYLKIIHLANLHILIASGDSVVIVLYLALSFGAERIPELGR